MSRSQGTWEQRKSVSIGKESERIQISKYVRLKGRKARNVSTH